MRKLLLAVACAAILGAAPGAGAQVYPSRPITVVVPFPPGGPTDTSARILAERMRGFLGQPVIVENVTGAGGSIGVGRVARAAPDGYSLSIGNWVSHVGAGAVYPVTYDVLADLDPVALLAFAPVWLIGKTALPASDARELLAWLKTHPDKVSAATVGPGSAAHLCGIYLQNHTGARFQFVPYRGGAPAYQDLIAGQVDLMCAEASQTLPHVRSGKIKAYAVLAETRWAAAPHVPTLDEAGVRGLHISLWQVLWVPHGTPQDVIAKLNSAIVDAFGSAMRQRLTELGFDLPARERQIPEMLGAFHRAEIEKWWPIIKAAHLKAE